MTTVTEHELITRTALDYFEGWFEGDVDRMERALHPDFVKRSPGDDQASSLGITTKERMLERTAAGGGSESGPGQRIDVRIEDVYHDIASVTIRSSVYREYVHLVRTRSGWKIANALWRLT